MERGMTGVSGTTNLVFAFPTDDANVWRLRHGSITFESGFTAGIEVEGGHIPHARDPRGLTVTYYVINSLKTVGTRVTGDVAMISCINGRVMNSVDIAHDVEVILPRELPKVMSAAATSKD